MGIGDQVSRLEILRQQLEAARAFTAQVMGLSLDALSVEAAIDSLGMTGHGAWGN